MLTPYSSSRRKPGSPKFFQHYARFPGGTYSMDPGFRRDDGLWDLEIIR
jgi:hypothetical protein